MDDYLKDRDAGYPTFISPFATICNARINLWNKWTRWKRIFPKMVIFGIP
jgi:hypothetical protein